MNGPGGPELARPRDLTAIFRDALAVLWANLGAFLALGAIVVVPVHLIVSGVGLEQLTAAYDPKPSAAEYAIPLLVNVFVVTPLITAMCIYALHSVSAGALRTRAVITEGFEAFSPIFFGMLLAALGSVFGIVFYLLIRWYFVPQAVVVERLRGRAALSRSAELTRGHWWRTFGILVIANLAALVPTLLLAAPFTALAESSDRASWALIGTIVTETISAPFLALVSTLLYYDLRARGPKSA